MGWNASVSINCLTKKLNALLNTPRTSQTLTDNDERIFAVLAGRPGKANDWDSVLTGAIAAIDLLASSLEFKKEECDHRRGPQKTKSFGFSHGGGQTHPKMLNVGGIDNEAALQEFAQNPSIKRLTGFASCE
jgi:hypothetical protein